MASVSTNRATGRRSVQFTGLDGKRRTIRLGKVSKRFADAVASHIEHLLASAAAGEAPPVQTAEFLASLSEIMHGKLVAAGLVLPREASKPQVPTVAEFAANYLAKRTDIKPASALAVAQMVRNLTWFFGDRPLDSITAGDAEDFKRWLATSARGRGARQCGLSPATVAKRLQYANCLFRDALRRKLIAENPFTDLKLPKAANPERQRYVSAEVIKQLLDVIPDAEFRLLIVLSRYLGLRVPSEAFSLTWDCVDWERSRLRVPSPKTAVHGKTFRVVPILPQVRPHLETVFEAAPEGATYILHRLRQRESARAAQRGFWANLNLRKLLTIYLERAGIPPWPKLFHNLRASAATDLAQRFPAYVCSEWLGHTEAIAKAHYLLTTEAHFQAAINPPERATQKPTQPVRAGSDLDVHGETESQKNPYFTGDTAQKVGVVGFETATDAQAFSAVPLRSDAKSDAIAARCDVADLADDDPLLMRLLACWERLGPGERQALLDAAERLAGVLDTPGG